MRLFLSIFFTFLTINVLAQLQTELYPIKIDHKWGFMNLSAEVVVEPIYDAISQEEVKWNRNFPAPSGFRLVELDDLLGLIDRRGEEVLKTEYLAIRPLNDSLFAVQVDSLFTLTNRRGEILMEERFEDVRLMRLEDGLSSEFFMVLYKKKWGIFHIEDGLLFPPKYADVIFVDVGRGYFKIKDKENDKVWGLMNRQGEQVLDFEYQEVKILHPNFVAAKKTERDFWAAWDSLGVELLEEKWWTLIPLNKHLVALKEKQTWWSVYIFNEKRVKEFPRGTQGFKILTEDLAQSRRGGKYGIVDSLGNEIVTPRFDEILTAPPPLFRVKNGLWGLFSLPDSMLVPFKYQVIDDFRGESAVVMKDDFIGILNVKGEEIIPTKYERFQDEGEFLKAFKGTTMMLYEMSDSFTVVSEEFFPEVYSMQIGYELENKGMSFSMSSIRAAGRDPSIQGNMQNVRQNQNSDGTFIDEIEFARSDWEFRQDEHSQNYYLFNKKTEKAATRPEFREVKKIGNTDLSLVFNLNKTVTNALSVKAVYPKDTACLAALFSHRKGKFITKFELMGLRKADFEEGLPYAVFINKDGKFGMIDRKGKILQKVVNSKGEKQQINFNYFGRFRNGMARFCIGGRMESVEQQKDEKLGVDHFRVFNREFFVTPERRFEIRHFRNFMMANQEGNEPLWGYIDTLGRVVMDAQFDFANAFKDTLVVNKKFGKWGIINQKNENLLPFKYAGITPFLNNRWKLSLPNDKPIFYNRKGHEIIGLQYSKFGGFNDGMCRVMQNNLWGFVNETGEETVACQYEDARNFSEGLAAVKSGEDWIFIDKTGQEILNPSKNISGILDLGNFNSGLCWFKVGEMYGYLNREGEIALEPKYTRAFDFQFGVARAVFNAKTGLINPEGKWILEPKEFEMILKFNELGLAEVRRHFKKERGLINNKGELLADTKYQEIGQFINGHARIKYKDLYGLINEKGEEIIPPLYANVKEVQNDLVAVMLPRKMMWHFRNLEDERAFKGDFQIVESFNQGIAFVHEHEYDIGSKEWIDTFGKPINPVPEHQVMNYSEGIFGMFDPTGIWGRAGNLNYYFSDPNGRNVFHKHYEDLEAFENGTAAFKRSGRWGLVNKFGMEPIAPKYSRVQHLPNKMVYVKPSVLFGIADSDGSLMLEAKYDLIKGMKNNIIMVQHGEEVGYLSDDYEWVWDLQK